MMEKIIAIAGKAGKAGKAIVIGGLKSGPAVLSASKFAESAIEVSGVADPVDATIFAFKMIIKRCLPPKYFVFGECTSLLFHIYAIIATGGEWSYTTVFLFLARHVIEKGEK